jgi:hypothetical protein
LPYLSREVVLNAAFSSATAFSTESFGIATNICSKTNDADGDGKSNAIDTDSDGDGCFDLVESGSAQFTSLTQETIAGAVGVNGVSSLVENNDTFFATDNYTLTPNFLEKSVKGCLDTDLDGVPNTADIDDDNDGVLDIVECDRPAPVTAFGFVTIAGTSGKQMYITNKSTGENIGKVTIAAVSNIAVDQLAGNALDYSVSGHWVDGALANSADRKMTVKFEPVAPYTALDAKILVTEGGNGQWGFHPRSLRSDGGSKIYTTAQLPERKLPSRHSHYAKYENVY